MSHDGCHDEGSSKNAYPKDVMIARGVAMPLNVLCCGEVLQVGASGRG